MQQCQLCAIPLFTGPPYSLPFAILPVPARSPFRFIRHWRRSTPNPGRGAFWCALQLKHSHGRPPMTAPTPHSINFSAKTRGRIASPQLHNLSRSPAVRRISHCASNISLRVSAISPVRKNGFHRGRKPATSAFLPHPHILYAGTLRAILRGGSFFQSAAQSMPRGHFYRCSYKAWWGRPRRLSRLSP